MSEHSELLTEAGMVQWEREVRGYNRQQVDEYVAWRSGQIRDLEGRLAQGLGEVERLRRELAEAREAGGRPAHEEISERVGQILKLAAEEAKADKTRSAAEIAQMRERAKEETDKLRTDAKRETDQIKAEAQDQAERMLTAAAEQSESSVATARAEAEQLVSTAQAAADRAVTEATKHAESTVSSAISQAKQQLDEATARATAIHDGAERRLNLLISRHTETVRRLTEIRDVVTSLVAGEAARGSLEDEVNRALSNSAAAAGDGRQAGQHEQQGGGHRGGPRQSGSGDGRHSGSSAAGPLDSAHSQPAHAGRTASATRSPAGQPGSRERADLGPARREGASYPGHDADGGKVAGENSGIAADGTSHATDAVRHATDSLEHATDSLRHSTSAVGSGSRASDRARDDTAPSTRVIDN
jgi:cell division septum initiation protein DivIVA